MGSPEGEGQSNGNDCHGEPPPPPEPSQDRGIVPPIMSPHLEGIDHLTPDNIDIFSLDAVAALKLLSRGAQFLVNLTGDVPPTPAIQSRADALSRAHFEGPTTSQRQAASLPIPGFPAGNENDNIDGVPFTRTPIGSPEAHMHEPIVHGSESQPASVQYAALVRKFYSKRPPPISLEDYLSRMHKFCPMSTAVYLATSHYVTHLAVNEKICPVTPRNVHRLVLAGLRVAMKALEDLKWPHSRFAKVGGVSEVELRRLEIGFCFLMDFGLKVDAQMLTDEAQNLVRICNSSAISEYDIEPLGIPSRLPELKNRRKADESADTNAHGDLPGHTAEKRKASSSLPMRPVQHVGQGIGIVGQS